jgi:glycine cleavage system H protein
LAVSSSRAGNPGACFGALSLAGKRAFLLGIVGLDDLVVDSKREAFSSSAVFARRGRSAPYKTSTRHPVRNLTSVFLRGVMKVRGHKAMSLGCGAGAPKGDFQGVDMEVPPGLKYSKEHEWVAADGAVATIGITDHAQDQLGEIVYLELPAVGEKVSKDDPFGVVESVKAVSDIYAPVSGTVVEINESLPESPEVINEDPYGDGWLIKVRISDSSELEDLMDAEEYEEMVASEKE